MSVGSDRPAGGGGVPRGRRVLRIVGLCLSVLVLGTAGASCGSNTI